MAPYNRDRIGFVEQVILAGSSEHESLHRFISAVAFFCETAAKAEGYCVLDRYNILFVCHAGHTKKRCGVGHLIRQPNQGSNKVCVRTAEATGFLAFFV